MAQSSGDWLRPEAPPEAAAPLFSPAAPAPMYALRPLSLGEILDRTFALYRSRFWLFASISAVSASVQVVVQAISLAAARLLVHSGYPTGPLRPGHPMPLHALLSAELGTWVAGLVFFLVSAITQAATSLAMSEVYLNRPTSAKEVLTVAVRRWYRWIAIALWQIGSMLWIPVCALVAVTLLIPYGARSHSTVLTALAAVLGFAAIFVGFPIGVILYLRNALAVPAAVVEHLGIRAAMRRSKALAAGTKGRIFVVLLIAACLYMVVGVLESPASLLILFAPGQEHYLAQGLVLVITFLGHTVVAPVALIGLTLLYFDQRVRKEAFDLQLLLEASRPPGAGGAASPPVSLASAPPEGFAPLG